LTDANGLRGLVYRTGLGYCSSREQHGGCAGAKAFFHHA
jgi:hypothetical protein